MYSNFEVVEGNIDWVLENYTCFYNDFGDENIVQIVQRGILSNEKELYLIRNFTLPLNHPVVRSTAQLVNYNSASLTINSCEILQFQVAQVLVFSTDFRERRLDFKCFMSNNSAGSIEIKNSFRFQ
jgi:hypothetical protein